jgi:hypothetical protein
MRTTLTLDDDVAAMLKRFMTQRGRSLKDAVNEGLRRGLAALDHPAEPAPPYRVSPWDLGGSLVGSLDNVEEVISRAEGERHR